MAETDPVQLTKRSARSLGKLIKDHRPRRIDGSGKARPRIPDGQGGTSVQLVVAITSALTRPGHYRGILGVRKSDVIDVDDTPVLAPSDYYDAGIEVTVVNWDEEGSNTHELMEDDRNRTLFPCWATGQLDTYDFPIYAIDGSNVLRLCNLAS